MGTLRTPLIMQCIILLGTCTAQAKPSPSPKNASVHSVQVKLFGSPCKIQGPFSEDTLQRVHTISPAELPQGHAASSSKQALSKLKKNQKVPDALFVYRDRQTKRLKAQLAFHQGFGRAAKETDPKELLNSVQPFFKKKKGLEKFSKKSQTLKKKSNTELRSALKEELLEIFELVIEPDPEEEFFRAIKSLKIEYVCNLGDL